MEVWAEIDDFPEYSVSDLGRVLSRRTDRVLNITVNQLGIPYVGLTKHFVHYKRAVAPLVARAFLTPPYQAAFDTPINLDGDRLNTGVENLMWRPRWFAVKYHRQFYIDRIGVRSVIEDVETEERFDTSFHAAIRFGLIDLDILRGIYRDEPVWPTLQKFRIV